MLRVGIVGVGAHGSRYVKHLAAGDVAGVKLVAIARRDRARGEQQAREVGARWFESARALCESDEVDAVIVATPADRHAEDARAAIVARKAVLIEKPVVTSVEEGRALIALAREHRVIAMAAQTLRFEPVYRAALERKDELGEIKEISCFVSRTEGARSSEGDARLAHRALLGHAVHQLDWAGLVIGRSFESAEARRTVGWLFAEDAKLSFDVRLSERNACELFTIVGERHRLVGDRLAHSLERVYLDLRRAEPIDIGPRVPTIPPLVAAFRDACAGAPVAIPLEDGVRAVARAEACIRSIASGRAEAIDEALAGTPPPSVG